ncbi:putative glycoside hydrolase family 20, catalytic domain, glycoside hydrolase superfamily [Septoria linicola]|nr:putative glycoside hydrolase family 20, catalytic domain, glycoside hydrolase superfamily [Septoria linicola]
MRGLLAVSLLACSVTAIWPLPKEYEHGKDVLWIKKGKVEVQYHHAGSVSLPDCPPEERLLTHTEQQPQSYSKRDNSGSASEIVQNAVKRTYDTLYSQNFVPWMLRPRLSDFEPDADGTDTYITTITIEQTGDDPKNLKKPNTDIDESYSLNVTADGKVTVSAKTSVGILWGLTTFTQLFFKHSKGGVYTDLAPVYIEDAPKFKWRGLNLDTSRTFKPLSDIYAMIDALSYNKMNRLHWHITDAQSWPLEVPALPDLMPKGVYEPSQKYSADDVRKVQEHGSLLGVEVAMEIDNPGHTSSIWFSDPDLITAFNKQPDWTTYCAEPPCGSLKLNSTKVYDFLETLLDDLLPRLKPLTSYFHLGGDEVNKNSYLLDDTVRSNESSVLQPLMQKYMDRNMNQTKAHGLTPLVWEEMLLEWNLTLPKDTIVQSWQSDDAVAEITAKGYQALVGNYNYWYLDCGKGQWLDFDPSNAAGFWPFQDYCAPYHNWRVMYSYDPLTGVPENSTHLVLGGETHIWSEQTDTVNLHQMVWPRTCAAAEVLWSGAKDAQGQNRSQIEASPRLAEMRERLVARGIKAEPFQMPFCTQNGTQCAYPS